MKEKLLEYIDKAKQYYTIGFYKSGDEYLDKVRKILVDIEVSEGET